MSGYIPESTLKKLKELSKQVEQNRNNTIFTASVNDNIPSYANVGSQNAALGPSTGISVAQPIYHFVDSADNSIQLAAHNIVLDAEGASSMILKTINGVVQDGTKIILSVRQGKTATLSPGGSIAIGTSIIMSDLDLAYLTFSKELGQFKLISSSNSSSSTLWSSVVIDAANITKDMRQGTLTNLGFISFDTNTGTSSLVIDGIIGTGITYNVPNTDGHFFKVAGTEFLRISTANGILISTITDLSHNTIQNVGQILNLDGNITPTTDLTGSNLGSDSKRFGIINSAVVANVNSLIFGPNVGSGSTRWINHSGGLIYNVLTGEAHSFQINFVETFNVRSGNASVTGFFTVSGQSSLNGAVFLGNLTTDHISFAGSLVGDILPLTDLTGSNLGSDAKRFAIINSSVLANVNNIIFGSNSSGTRWIRNSGGLIYNVLTGEAHSWQVNFVGVMSLNATSLTVPPSIISGSTTITVSQISQLNGANTWTSSNQFNLGISINATTFVILNHNDSGDSYIRQSTGIGAVPKKVDIASFADVCFQAVGENTTALSRGLIKAMQQAGDPTTTQIPSGYAAINKNTSTGAVKWWYNDGGVLKSVAMT